MIDCPHVFAENPVAEDYAVNICAILAACSMDMYFP
jgi:hypothetical protein